MTTVLPATLTSGSLSAPLDFSGILRASDPELPRPLATESGLRTRDAGELRDRLTPYLFDYGITRVAHLTGFDYVGLPVHMAVKPQGRSLSSGSGKGPTPNASWVSAVMEACEQSVWEALDPEGVTASESLMGRLGLPFASGNDLPRFKGAVWGDHIPVEWIPGWDIARGEEVWVPEGVVTIRLTTTFRLNPFVSGSNGLASGAHVLEAVLSGLQEAIERDGMTLNTVAGWRPHRDGMPALRAAAPEIAAKVERSGLRLDVVDATTEVGVPTIVAYLLETDGPANAGSFKGAGAGTTAATALVRAVTEAAQARALIIAGARDDILQSSRAAGAVDRPSVVPDPHGVYAMPDMTAPPGIVESIAWMVDRLAQAGFHRVIVFRHSEPSDPVQVVRVVVPGLEGYPFSHAGLGARGIERRRVDALERAGSK